MMTVDEKLLCSFQVSVTSPVDCEMMMCFTDLLQILKPVEKKFSLY